MEDKKILKEAIKSRGVKQAYIAEKLEICPSALSMNLTRDKMGLDNFRKILDVLDYDVVVVDRQTGEEVWTVDE